MYETIINPITNRKCSIYNNLGKKILQNYLQILQYPVIYGGAESKSIEPKYLKRVREYGYPMGKHPENIQKKFKKLVEEFNKKLVEKLGEDAYFYELQKMGDREDLFMTFSDIHSLSVIIFFPKSSSIITLKPQIYLESFSEEGEENLLFHERWFEVNLKEGQYWNPGITLVDIFEKLEIRTKRYRKKGWVKPMVDKGFPYNLIVIDKSLGNLENLNQAASDILDNQALKILESSVTLRNDKLGYTSEPYINPFHIPSRYHEDGHQYDKHQQSNIFIDYLFSLIFYFTYYNAYEIKFVQDGEKMEHPAIDSLKNKNNLHNFAEEVFHYKYSDKIDSIQGSKIFNTLQYIYKYGLLYQQIKIIEEKKGGDYFCVIANILAKLVNIYVGEILHKIFIYCKHHDIELLDTLNIDEDGCLVLHNILDMTIGGVSENTEYHVQKELFEISEDFLEQIYQNAKAIPENELITPSI